MKQGLNDAHVLESRQKHGANVLTPPAKTPWWRELLDKFKDPLIIVLLIAGVLSIGISFYEYYGLDQTWKVFFEPIGIFIAILLATVLAFLFESKANRAFRILNQVNDDEPVNVVRNGSNVTIPRRDVVVGDIVILSTGDEIPADGQLLDAVTLSVDESTLTGEPITHKTIDPESFDKAATYPSDHVYRGTKIMEGHGVMRVLTVGDATEMGNVFVASQIDDSVKTPLDEQFDRLAALVTKASYIIGVLIVVGRMITFNDWGNWVNLMAYALQTVMIAVTLIVVAVPEGLPMAVTLSLAYSMSRMLKTNNLVRKMHACETMGATTVICTDKTGTLTQNCMQVSEMNLFGDTPAELLDEGLAVNSTAALDFSHDKTEPIGNPTEGALLLWLYGKGIDYRTVKESAVRLAELPFSTERKYMATVVKSAVTGKDTLYVKGAPEIVMNLCDRIAGDKTREEIGALLLGYQKKGMRTLGFAYRTLDEAYDGATAVADLVKQGGLTFIGVTAIFDPVRADVPAAIAECTDAGIDIKIVTGDTSATATEIGRQIGLWRDDYTERNIITGEQLAALTDEQLAERAPDWKIISRARPTDKKRLVEALQKRGNVVAVTGDGTNDAPALRQAHVGLSMGDGTSVAKEASDITIIDNSFTSIGRAVMWGRSLYKNIQRFLLFQLTVNVAACLLVLFGAFIGTESPLTVTQMLWVNLIMDTFGAMALASLPPSQGVMKDKPRDRNASILTGPMTRELFGVGVLFFLITFGFYWLFNHAEVTSLVQMFSAPWGAYKAMTTYEGTLLFSIFVWTHFWYMFDARVFDTHRSIFHTPMSQGFWTIVIIIVAGQLFITEIAYEFFNVAPMIHTLDWKFNASGTLDLAIIIVASSLVLWIRELYHAFTLRR